MSPDTGGPGWTRQAGLVAGVTARDLLRRRATWTTTLVGGVVIAVLVLGSAVIGARTRARAEQVTYVVAVDGDLAGGADFLEAVAAPSLEVRPAPDAAAEVTEGRAATGLTLSADLDTRLRAGEAIEVDTYYRSLDDGSRAGLAELLLVVQALQGDELAAQARQVGVEPPAGTDVEAREVTADADVNRLLLAPVLAAVACLLCLSVVSSASAAVGSARDDRSVEATLVLPFTRTALAAGVVGGALPAAVPQLLVAVALIAGVAVAPLPGLGQSATTVAVALATALPAAALLGVLAAALGVLAGVLGAGADDAVSLGDLLAVPFVGVAAAFFLAPAAFGEPWAWTLPLIGPAAMLRDGVAGTLGLGQVVVTTVASLSWTAVVVVLAAQRIGDERRVLRVR